LEALEDRITPTTFTPTLFTDGVPGFQVTTLREAVLAADNDGAPGSGTDTIQLSAGTYKLTVPNTGGQHEVSDMAGDLNITNTAHALIIQGTTDANGHPTTIIQQTVADRVFQIVNPGTTVTFKNLIIEGGNAQDDGSAGAAAGKSTAQGGGILDDGGNVTLSNVVVQSNLATAGNDFAAQGGGLFAQNGSLTINSSVIQNNLARGGTGTGGATGFEAQGGGVCYLSTGALTITGSTVANNRAQGGAGNNATGTDGGEADGGGVYSAADTTTITGSTLSGNEADSGGGGTGAEQFGAGGGAHLFGSNTIVNSTIANNKATGVGDAAGGGVYFGKGATGTLTNVTVAGNQANLTGPAGTGEGGGLDNNNGSVKEVTLVNTVVAGNTTITSAGSPHSPDIRGEFTSGGHNLIGIADGANQQNNLPAFSVPGDLAGSLASPLNAKLGPLQNNGGPTQTMLPLPGSPLLGAGNGSLAPATDQRGLSRGGGASDIGAAQVTGVGGGVAAPPALHTPFLLAFFDQFLKGVETLNADGTVTVTDSFFGFTLLVSTYDSAGNLVRVSFLGFDLTLLFV
jgi:hypothetical protein